MKEDGNHWKSKYYRYDCIHFLYKFFCENIRLYPHKLRYGSFLCSMDIRYCAYGRGCRNSDIQKTSIVKTNIACHWKGELYFSLNTYEIVDIWNKINYSIITGRIFILNLTCPWKEKSGMYDLWTLIILVMLILGGSGSVAGTWWCKNKKRKKNEEKPQSSK